ncbi:hypothetical protein RR48_12327 [Papilio machaon]|uniref:Uncharacterized protein n=1 Tax=Papilio machaon TaxID=76193 RepID=A0A194QTD7_PAPMA|nr:hypothetical protein RR48_12327 [Papilio machaon]
MSDEESVDIKQELLDLLTNVQPNLQDVIKRSFTNVILQQNKNGEQIKPDVLEDTSYFAKNTQVNLTRLELLRTPTFHLQTVSLNLKSMALSLKCSLGETKSQDLPLTAAVSLPLYALLRHRLQRHLALVLRQATSVSDLLYSNPSMLEVYR